MSCRGCIPTSSFPLILSKTRACVNNKPDSDLFNNISWGLSDSFRLALNIFFLCRRTTWSSWQYAPARRTSNEPTYSFSKDPQSRRKREDDAGNMVAGDTRKEGKADALRRCAALMVCAVASLLETSPETCSMCSRNARSCFICQSGSRYFLHKSDAL